MTTRDAPLMSRGEQIFLAAVVYLPLLLAVPLSLVTHLAIPELWIIGQAVATGLWVFYWISKSLCC